jgi:hypothetical protein
MAEARDRKSSAGSGGAVAASARAGGGLVDRQRRRLGNKLVSDRNSKSVVPGKYSS